MYRSIWTNPVHFIACGFGVGALPGMPGTFGTMLGVLIYTLLRRLPLAIYILMALLMVLIGIWLCGCVNRDWATTDHPAAVWDEVAAFPWVMIGIPSQWQWILAGFLLFRFFDIVKPWPISLIDRQVHGGLGVMLDDCVAAAASWLVLFLSAHLLGI